MVFSSIVFVCAFLPLVLLIYYLLPGLKLKNALLIIASLIFYAYGEPVYILLMILSTIMNYIFGRLLEIDAVRHSAGRRKLVLALSVIANLSMLIMFKYTDMIIESINAVAGLNMALPNITLPIGISFFTFQAMSYVIDAYRGDTEVQKKYTNVLLYITFFPQLIAGPIVRYADIQKEIENRSSDLKEVALGFRRFIIGLGKKVLISNVVALTVDNLFALDVSVLNAPTAWIAAISYMLQIYFDFSGYSDMAIGMGLIFGFHFKENFDYPYTASSIKEFWRKWHISLSTWFKEYLYIPLGGNRKGRIRTAVNKIIVFFATGLWHGADWTFVIWGLWHGLFLLLEDVLTVKNLPKLIKHIYTLLIVCIGFVVFRADTLAQGLSIIGAMFTGWSFSPDKLQVMAMQLTPLFIFIMSLGMITSVVKINNLNKGRFINGVGYVLSIAILILSMLSLAGNNYNPFIYFRF